MMEVVHDEAPGHLDQVERFSECVRAVPDHAIRLPASVETEVVAAQARVVDEAFIHQKLEEVRRRVADRKTEAFRSPACEPSQDIRSLSDDRSTLVEGAGLERLMDIPI